MDGGGVRVELHLRGLDQFIGPISIRHVHTANVGVQEQRLVGVEVGHGGNEVGGGDGALQLLMKLSSC